MTSRPTRTLLRLTSRGRSIALERALTDFGAEESFERAARRLKEHYGVEMGRTTVLRVVEQRAHEAERYVEERLQEARKAFDAPVSQRPGVDTMLVEADGCEIRTGTLVAANDNERTQVRGLAKRRRNQEWRDVSVGLARALDEVTPRFVAGMKPYDDVIGQLFSAAVERGLSTRTRVVGVADGGNGLREALDAKFVNLRFILDRPHLKQHLNETADAMGLDVVARDAWTQAALAECEVGNAATVVESLRDFAGPGEERVHRLAGYLERFKDAVDYDKAREQGYPIGSGEIESAHRYIPQKRLKLPGACWSPSTINPMLALRVLRENGWWEDFWNRDAA